jgi:hypothetical protein
MSSIKNSVYDGNGPVSVTIGSQTFAVISVAEDNQSADGGDCAEPRVVPGYTEPVSYTHKHKLTVLLITVDSATLRGYLKQQNYWNPTGDNQPLPLVVREKNAAGQFRNVTYKTANTLLVKMHSVLQQLAKEQITELTINTFGDDNSIYGAWT